MSILVTGATGHLGRLVLRSLCARGVPAADVIAAGSNMTDHVWSVAQSSMAKLSTNGRLIVAEGSGHAVHLEKPEFVIDAISGLVAEIRASN